MMNALRRIRQERGLPIEVLARRAKVGARAIWLWEAWNLPPKRREIAQKIADALGVTLDELGYNAPVEVS